MKTQIFCCSLCYNPLQRYTRSLEIKGETRTLRVKPGELATLPNGASKHRSLNMCVTLNRRRRYTIY